MDEEPQWITEPAPQDEKKVAATTPTIKHDTPKETAKLALDLPSPTPTRREPREVSRQASEPGSPIYVRLPERNLMLDEAFALADEPIRPLRVQEVPDVRRKFTKEQFYHPPTVPTRTLSPVAREVLKAVAEEESETKAGSASAVTTPTANADAATHENAAQEKDDNGFTYYKCRFCGLTFSYMNTLRAHERVHNVQQPYVCGACGESFHFACELEYHAQQHKDVDGYRCDCGRRFFTYTEMLYHKHPEDEPAKGMPEIVTASTSSPTLAANEFPVPQFKEEGFEPKHPLKVYSDVRLKPYICEYCSKSYPDSRQLAYHMYSHRGEKIFNPRASRYLMGRQGIGYTDRPSLLY